MILINFVNILTSYVYEENLPLVSIFNIIKVINIKLMKNLVLPFLCVLTKKKKNIKLLLRKKPEINIKFQISMVIL